MMLKERDEIVGIISLSPFQRVFRVQRKYVKWLKGVFLDAVGLERMHESLGQPTTVDLGCHSMRSEHYLHGFEEDLVHDVSLADLANHQLP
jgi:hypothetical protein